MDMAIIKKDRFGYIINPQWIEVKIKKKKDPKESMSESVQVRVSG